MPKSAKRCPYHPIAKPVADYEFRKAGGPLNQQHMTTDHPWTKKLTTYGTGESTSLFHESDPLALTSQPPSFRCPAFSVAGPSLHRLGTILPTTTLQNPSAQVLVSPSCSLSMITEARAYAARQMPNPSWSTLWCAHSGEWRRVPMSSHYLSEGASSGVKTLPGPHPWPPPRS